MENANEDKGLSIENRLLEATFDFKIIIPWIVLNSQYVKTFFTGDYDWLDSISVLREWINERIRKCGNYRKKDTIEEEIKSKK